MRWLVAISVVRAGKDPVLPGVAFCVDTAEIGDELVALEAARDAEPDEVPTGDADGDAPPLLALANLPPLDAARLTAIEAVLPRLDAEAFTAAGAPKILALRALVGFIPTAEETARFKRAEA